MVEWMVDYSELLMAVMSEYRMVDWKVDRSEQQKVDRLECTTVELKAEYLANHLADS